jgi:dTMP kinase
MSTDATLKPLTSRIASLRRDSERKLKAAFFGYCCDDAMKTNKPDNYEEIMSKQDYITKQTLNNNLYDYTKAKFITFEGLEGCGKSTQCKMLYDYLLLKNIKVILTREIGGVDSAEAIRDIVVNKELLPMSELMLVMAARHEHIQKLILPKLQDNHWVICDRFIDSTVCYQGITPEIGKDKIYLLHQQLMLNLLPDITYFIDVEPNEALSRTLNRNDNNKFEDKNLEFHRQVYQGFHNLAKQFPKRIVRIDANDLTKEQVHQEILRVLPI